MIFAGKPTGFTLIEMMVTIAIISILAAVAVPSYTSFVYKSQLSTAKADTKALALVMENYYQKTLAYKTLVATDDLTAKFSGWKPASSSANYTFSAVATATGYTITATGAATGNTNCKIELTESGTCNITNCKYGNATGSCP